MLFRFLDNFVLGKYECHILVNSATWKANYASSKLFQFPRFVILVFGFQLAFLSPRFDNNTSALVLFSSY